MNVRTWSGLDRVRTRSNGGVCLTVQRPFYVLRSAVHNKSVGDDEGIAPIILFLGNTGCWAISFTPRPWYPLTMRLSEPHCCCGADANRLRLDWRPAAITWNGRWAEQLDFDMFLRNTKIVISQTMNKTSRKYGAPITLRSWKDLKDHVRDGRRSEKWTRQAMYV